MLNNKLSMFNCMSQTKKAKSVLLKNKQLTENIINKAQTE